MPERPAVERIPSASNLYVLTGTEITFRLRYSSQPETIQLKIGYAEPEDSDFATKSQMVINPIRDYVTHSVTFSDPGQYRVLFRLVFLKPQYSAWEVTAVTPDEIVEASEKTLVKLATTMSLLYTLGQIGRDILRRLDQLIVDSDADEDEIYEQTALDRFVEDD